MDNNNQHKLTQEQKQQIEKAKQYWQEKFKDMPPVEYTKPIDKEAKEKFYYAITEPNQVLLRKLLEEEDKTK